MLNKNFIFVIAVASIFTLFSQPHLDLEKNILEQLTHENLWDSSIPLRLHLGCGENKFKGYVNIDFSPSEHSIQTNLGADIFANLITVNFPKQTVKEIRSHHVFEHFDRQTALALLCKWYQWLEIDGLLIIETPDFETNIKMLVNPRYSYQQKQSILRHLSGSHEASWAIHCDGWYKDKFHRVLTALGFEEIRFEFTSWQLTRNIIVYAKKKHHKSKESLQNAAHLILRDSLIDNSSSEEKLWQLWCTLFNKVYQG